MSTVNLYYKLIGILSSGAVIKAGSTNNPVAITAASDVGADTTYIVPTATVFTFTDDLDASTNILMLISPVDGTLEWDNGTDANNSSVGVKANVPFIFGRLVTTEYSATASTRTSNAATATITTIRFYQSSGSDAKVRIVTFD